MSVEWTAGEEGREEEQIEFSWAGETARHVGTVVHRWLQRMAEDRLDQWTPSRIGLLKPRFRGELEQRGVPLSDIKRASDLVLSALHNTIADERGRWLLGPHREALTEYRLRSRGGRGHVMDMVFADGPGISWIVDFKTSTHEGADTEAFLDSEQERYRSQLERYASAVGNNVRIGIYFPMLRAWRVL
jgi:hypothetical protein